MPAGRPTLYDPSYCDRVIEWGTLGKSKAWMAAELNVSKQSLYQWEHDYPQFSDAITLAMLKSQQWWEDAGQKGLDNSISAPIWSRSMAARFPADWREKTAQEISGPDGGPIPVSEVRRVIVDPDNTDAS